MDLYEEQLALDSHKACNVIKTHPSHIPHNTHHY